jgi:hypothetical protein
MVNEFDVAGADTTSPLKLPAQHLCHKANREWRFRCSRKPTGVRHDAASFVV